MILVIFLHQDRNLVSVASAGSQKKNGKQGTKAPMEVSKVAPSVKVDIQWLPPVSETKMGREIENTEPQSAVDTEIKVHFPLSMESAGQDIAKLENQHCGMPPQPPRLSKKGPLICLSKFLFLV